MLGSCTGEVSSHFRARRNDCAAGEENPLLLKEKGVMDPGQETWLEIGAGAEHKRSGCHGLSKNTFKEKKKSLRK